VRRHLITRPLRAALAALLFGAATLSAVVAQTVTRPTWTELSPPQKEALAPLAKDWNTLESDRKQKWLEVATKYPQLSPDGKQRLHERMAEFARLTPAQRQTARENFRRAYELPPDQRQAALQAYQGLDAEQRQGLAKKAEPPRRPTRELRSDRKAPPATSGPAAQPGR
jgi:hypothetical protein